jgi:hypothetical protein
MGNHCSIIGILLETFIKLITTLGNGYILQRWYIQLITNIGWHVSNIGILLITNIGSHVSNFGILLITYIGSHVSNIGILLITNIGILLITNIG